MSRGIFFRGILKEGNYTLIKTTNGWVLNGEDIIYAGFDEDRPQGEWIVHKINGIPHTAECSCCHNHYDYEDLRRIGGVKWIIDLSYCPNCGARMFAKDINVHNKEGVDDENMDVL